MEKRKFEVAKTYTENDVLVFEIVKRTAKFVTYVEIQKYGKYNEIREEPIEKEVKFKTKEKHDVVLHFKNTQDMNKAFATLKEHIEIEMLKTMSYEEINALLNKQKERIDELEKAGADAAVHDGTLPLDTKPL